MTEQKKKRTITEKRILIVSVIIAILVMAGITFWLFSSRDAEVVTADIYIDGRLVVEESVPTPTPTLEPGEIRITGGPARYGGVADGRCYVDALTLELIHTGREVSCDDWETAITTPRPEILIEIDVINSTLWVNMDYIGKLEIEDHGPILITGTLESIIMEGPLTIQDAPTMTPTPEPTVTPTPEPTEVLITDGVVKYSILVDGRYHAIPVCTYWEDDTQWLIPCLAQSPLRPQRKAVGIRNYSESTRGIFFDADPDVADEFAEFGSLFHTTSGWYELDVGSRYDFGEVLTYLENYPYKWECGILCDDWRDTDE